MRDQPMLVTALTLFTALVIVLRVPMVDRDHNGVDDSTEGVVLSDNGYLYVQKSRMPFDYSHTVIVVGFGENASNVSVEEVDEEWVRWNVQPNQ